MRVADLLPATFEVAHWDRSDGSPFPRERTYERRVIAGPGDVPQGAEATTYDRLTWWTGSTVERVVVGLDGRVREECALPRAPDDA